MAAKFRACSTASFGIDSLLLESAIAIAGCLIAAIAVPAVVDIVLCYSECNLRIG